MVSGVRPSSRTSRRISGRLTRIVDERLPERAVFGIAGQQLRQRLRDAIVAERTLQVVAGVERFRVDLPFGVRVGEIRDAVGEIRRVMEVEGGEPRVHHGRRPGIERPPRQQIRGRLLPALFQQGEAVELWIDALVARRAPGRTRASPSTAEPLPRRGSQTRAAAPCASTLPAPSATARRYPDGRSTPADSPRCQDGVGRRPAPEAPRTGQGPRRPPFAASKLPPTDWTASGAFFRDRNLDTDLQ